MKVLLIGSGGREHAMAHALTKSKQLTQCFVAPGNPGTLQCAENVPIPVDDIHALCDFAKSTGIDLTIVGPEQPLALGIVDLFESQGLAIVGPNKTASLLESSKAWAKAKYKKYGIPTAEYQSFESADLAIDYVTHRNTFPIVIKADGLAAGKGVTIAQSLDEAIQAIHDCLTHGVFNDAGQCVVIEDFLVGEEVSMFAFTDGTTVCPMISAQDHKALLDGDKGPNTGGMGAYSPAPLYSDAIHQKVMDRILIPLVNGFKSDGIEYKGILYAGLMIDESGDPYVVEFNIRLGDPEAQIILPKLTTDFLSVCLAISQKRLADITLTWNDLYTVCVVMASKGYPATSQKGVVINGLQDAADSHSFVFHAGTALSDSGEYLTNGGRVLNVCAEADTLKTAIKTVYHRIERISFDGAYYRTDIGQKGLRRLQSLA